MRIEAGSDDDEGTTTGAGRVSRAVRLAVRTEAERDDDDAAMTGAGAAASWASLLLFTPDPRGWVAVRIEGRRRDVCSRCGRDKLKRLTHVSMFFQCASGFLVFFVCVRWQKALVLHLLQPLFFSCLKTSIHACYI